MLLVIVIGGGGVQMDGYDRLDRFILLEKNNQLEDAKDNPKNYDSIFRIDLKEFKNSAEFRDYLQKYDASVDRAEAISIGWIFSLLTEISVLLQKIILFAKACYCIQRKRVVDFFSERNN
jgi:hypothetical protein